MNAYVIPIDFISCSFSNLLKEWEKSDIKKKSVTVRNAGFQAYVLLTFDDCGIDPHLP